MSATEWKICCALDEQHWRSLLVRPIIWQVTDKYKKPFRSRSLDESIGTGVSDGVDTPTHQLRSRICKTSAIEVHRKKQAKHMSEVTIIGVDLAKQSFQVHGAEPDGSVVFRKKLTRGQVLLFLAEQPRCIVAMEACATAHDWGRQIRKPGHEVKLIPAQYVKPYVKRQKNDRADAEAIAEAATRPTMRFVEVKTEDQQSRATLFRTRQMLVT